MEHAVRESRLARRVWLGLFASATAVGVLVLTLNLVPVEPTLYEKDFVQEYLLARAILDGSDPYQPIEDLAASHAAVGGYFQKQNPTPHPPTVGLLALPLGLVSYPLAAQIWFGFELVCLLGAVILLARRAGWRLRLRSAPLLALALVAWPPMILELGLGQLMLPILLTLAGAQVGLLSRRSVLGGALLGLTLLIKPIAWPWLILLGWHREWRAIGSAAIVGAGGVILSVIAIGLDRNINYVTHVLPEMTAGFLAEPTNMSLWTVAPRLGSISLSGLLPAAVLGMATWWVCRGIALEPGLAMMTTVSLLISPITWYFYFVLALLPLAYIGATLWQRTPRRAEVAAALGVVALLSVSQSQLIALGRSGLGAGVLLEPAVALTLLGCLLTWLSRPEWALGKADG